MQSPSEVSSGYTLAPRLRVFAGGDMILGWGKIMLLENIRETGSIAEAARRMDISYNHAWTLIRLMNAHFQSPLVEATRGGPGKGGAQITVTGETVLRLYREMVESSRQAMAPQWKQLRKLLVPLPPAGENPPEAQP